MNQSHCTTMFLRLPTAIFFALVVALLPLTGNLTAQAAGVSPPAFEIRDVVSNVPIKRTFTVTRSDGSAPGIIILSTRNDPTKMIRFPDGEKLLFPQGAASMPVNFTIFSTDIPTGNYTVFIRTAQGQLPPGFALGTKRSRKSLESRLEAAGGNGSMNLSGAEVDIYLQVTNKIIEKWEVSNANMRNSEEDIPVNFNMTFDNQGGTKAKPGSVKIRIEKEKDPTFIHEEEISADKLDYTDAYKKRELTVFTNAKLKKGRYVAAVSVYDNDKKLVYSKEKMTFQVVAAGELAQKALFQKFSVDRPVDEIPPTYAPKETVTISGIIKNTGEKGFMTNLKVDLYQGDKKLAALKSKEEFVPLGLEGEFEVSYSFEEEGEYTLKAHFPYGIGKTEEKTLTVMVAKEQAVATKENVLTHSVGSLLGKASLGNFDVTPLIAGGAVLLLLIVLYLRKKKKGYPIGALCLLEHKTPTSKQDTESHKQVP